ncbi:hypothetical protein C4Q31_17480 [Leptospira borgpetersenii serovar Ceylonica]|uniref:Uncharacterized protein n=1 Tax=Leptospira borgpetersenii str. 200701203 TaxID=1193007 RepID=M3GSC5_LEPBO|nr:Uncharacterized protein LB4E_3483 [Leptospira borgpetersenii str. 4E]AXX17371.1 hypothetical protein C4Q31_17480 [Leptospira borgpetersenii serovar Ceylonica]EMF97728.1 hypothetical protein LEP1GSC123_1233 [Leptospira borgpetersenii str. 200701203]EMO09489.1 hypothetical protein LEP1GSC137_0345 [Leptospira borgpetersenii str. Noumea 25]OOV42175.1 hypothetical protein B1H38_15805 [Leptospira borgpetersenii serovar Ballum]PTM46396.1 hypothetical protein CLV95_11176 [Leptospira borgpetersenii 
MKVIVVEILKKLEHHAVIRVISILVSTRSNLCLQRLDSPKLLYQTYVNTGFLEFLFNNYKLKCNDL